MQLSVSVISLLKLRHLDSAKKSYTEETNGQNNDDKAKEPTLSSLLISVNYCNILTYFCVTHNKFKAALTVLSITACPCIVDAYVPAFPP